MVICPFTILDEVDEGAARVGLLEEGLVEEDDPGDALQLGLGHREEELSVLPPVVFGVVECDVGAGEPLAHGALRLVGGQDALW